ncbi:hypothetical protein F3Y22_tig00112000pilonHSYRG00088 [Hibiscus syriacus]|uniref:Uncharacterized protein n=1 Tax=Hibiscus syriacus TaxID=106335 RepID=A0A6A2XW12_HIBSY|nr:hypothetical protein F3Y22_tig00112000pilonHSYRG00088 [Hibiscus syriacus]
MDFQCLTRKELQFLCKRNKIPANITNVAMVDALNALELVEGFEELQNQSQSPEKTVNKEILGTVTRTSTRRKPCKDEHQSTQSTIRTRKTSRKTMDVEEKNKSLNVPEVEVKDQRKSDIVETPLTSGRSKVNAQKGSFQPAYGTRRSVRLLGKSMAGLSIKESEKMPAKVDEMVEGEDGSKNCQSVTLELPLARNLSASLEDERELKDDVEENSKCVNVETDETGEKLIHEDGSYRESNEKTELEGEDKTADDPLGIIDPKGSDDNAVSEDSINLNEELVADKADDVAVSNDACEIENLNEKPAADETREAYEEPVVDETKSIANVEDVPEEVSDHSSSADTEAMHDDVTILPEAEEHADGHGDVSQNVSVLLAEGHMDSSEEKGNEESNDDDAFLGDSDFNNDTGSESKSLAEEQITALSVPDLPAEVHMESSAKKGNEESNDDDDAFLGDSNIDDDTGSDSKSSADELQEEVLCEQEGRSIPTGAYSYEGPRNMVYEESESSSSDDDDDDSTVNEETVDDGDDDSTVNEEADDDDDETDEASSEDSMTKMVSEEASVDANVTEALCEQKGRSIPTGAHSYEGPRNMVYEESELFDDDSTVNEETVDDGDDDSTAKEESAAADDEASSEDSMTNKVSEEASVDANVTEAETTLVSSFHSGSQSIVDDIAQKMVECGGSEALINVCVKPAEDLADKTPVSNSETITTSMPLSSPSKAQFLQLSKSSNKEQTTVGKVTQESDNLKKENIVEKELAKHKLESLSLRQLKKLNKMFDKLEISHKQPCGKSSRPALQMLPQNSMKSEDGEKQN